MSLPANTSAQIPNTATVQPLGSQYVVRGLNFQYQISGGAYYVGGDFSGTVGQNASRYFQAC